MLPLVLLLMPLLVLPPPAQDLLLVIPLELVLLAAHFVQQVSVALNLVFVEPEAPSVELAAKPILVPVFPMDSLIQFVVLLVLLMLPLVLLLLLPLVLLLLPLLVQVASSVHLDLPLELVLLVVHTAPLVSAALDLVFVVPLVITVELDAKPILDHALPMD